MAAVLSDSDTLTQSAPSSSSTAADSELRFCSTVLAFAGCRSPKGFRRPFNVVTRSFLKYRLLVRAKCASA
jgi:hypothetical protein